MKTKRRKQSPSFAMKALATHFESTIPAVRSLLGRETEKGMDQLYQHYLSDLEKVGKAAREKAIADAIAKIKTGAVEAVLEIMEIRKSLVKKVIPKAKKPSAPAVQLAEAPPERNYSHES